MNRILNRKYFSSVLASAILSLIFLGIISCDKNEGTLPPPITNGCDTTNVSYATTISTIIVRDCYCHGSLTGGYQFDNYANTQKNTAALKGALDPTNKMYAYLQDACDAPKIIAWINQGAKNN